MTQDDEPVGSLAEEAVKLLGALSDWAKDATPDLDAHLATGSAECTYCPICRTVHLARDLRPEVKEQLATAATSALTALAGLLSAASTSTSRAQDAPGGVEHIDLDDNADWPDEEDDR